MSSFVSSSTANGYRLIRALGVMPRRCAHSSEVLGMATTTDGMRSPNSRIDSCGDANAQKLIHANSTHEYPRPHLFFRLRVTAVDYEYSARSQRSARPVRTISSACDATANHNDMLRLTPPANAH